MDQDLTLYLVYFIGICILANELYAIDCFKMHKNKFDHMIIQRKGYVSAQRMMIMRNTCISGAVFLLAHIVLLSFIHCFLEPLYAEGMLVSENMCLLASDVTLNLVLYLVLSTAGMILFSDLCLCGHRHHHRSGALSDSALCRKRAGNREASADDPVHCEYLVAGIGNVFGRAGRSAGHVWFDFPLLFDRAGDRRKVRHEQRTSVWMVILSFAA